MIFFRRIKCPVRHSTSNKMIQKWYFLFSCFFNWYTCGDNVVEMDLPTSYCCFFLNSSSAQYTLGFVTRFFPSSGKKLLSGPRIQRRVLNKLLTTIAILISVILTFSWSPFLFSIFLQLIQLDPFLRGIYY